VDSRQLKVCATCFDLSVSLLRVLEMTITLVPEIFLDWSRPTSEMLLRRLAQVCPSGQGGGTLGITQVVRLPIHQ
jgi:Kip1 ubiquitination-promoting complex protein 1